MRHDFLDRYSRLPSPVHRLQSAVKLTAALALIICLVATHLSAWWFFSASFVVIVGLTILARIPLSFLVRRVLTLEPFVLGVAVLGFFQPGGGIIVLAVVVKSTLCLMTAILLSNTTPFPELLRVLRSFGAPRLLVSVLALMYRYVFVLIDEAERMHRARLGRTFTPGRRHLWAALATVVGQLFVRSTERAERIYAAMLARGWR